LGLRPVRLERCQATVRAFLLEGSFFYLIFINMNKIVYKFN